MMELFLVNAANFKIDGGACFGVVPKEVWSKVSPCDKNNMLYVSTRCLLIKTEQKLILVDTGLGDKQDEKYFSHFRPFGNPDLSKSFSELGISFDDVTDVIFTHLHFDHCGGAVKRDAAGNLVPVFRNAMHWCTSSQWEWALHPNSREKASYFLENYVPLHELGKLSFIDEEKEFVDGVFLRIMNGHTEGQIVPVIEYKGKTIVYTADFIPSANHIPLAYVPAYDVRPLVTVKEKELMLNEAAEKGYIFLFQHDYARECCTVHHTEKGVRVKEVFKLKSIV